MSILLTAPARPHQADFTVRTEAALTDLCRSALAAQLAALTRAAYRDSDLLPHLPVPDGARESTDEAEADLAAGQLLWVARDVDQRAVGALRVRPGVHGWEVRRIAVSPAWRGRGLVQALLAAVEEAATGQGVPALKLDAVVERCLPPLYAHLGYTPVRVFRADDKPLTEWHMERRLDQRSTVTETAGRGLFLGWYVADGSLLAAARYAPDADTALAQITPSLPSAASLAGVDHLPGADDTETLLRHLPAHSVELAAGVFTTRLPRTDVAFHLLPRSFEPRLVSLTRTAPGRELPLAIPARPRTSELS